MQLLECRDMTEWRQKAEALHDAWCDDRKCPTPKRDRGTLYLTNPVQHVDTMVIAVVVPDTRLLDPADAARVVTVPPADEHKWQPVWDATGVTPGPK